MRLMSIVAVGMLAVGPRTASAQTTAIDAATRLYRDFAWEVVFAGLPQGATGFAQSPRATLLKYVDTSLARLLIADQTCLARGEGICNLDFAPLWGSQDAQASDLEIAPTSDPTIIRVKYTVTGSDQQVTVDLLMTRIPAGWRVKDIVYEGGNTLKGILTGG